jgi:hypothetical protein
MRSDQTNGKGKVSRRKFLASSTALASAVGALSGVGSAQQGQESARSVSDRARAIRVRLTWHLMCRTPVPSGRPPPMRTFAQAPSPGRMVSRGDSARVAGFQIDSWG